MQYYNELLLIAKQGNNPWWPGEVKRCPKTNLCVQEVDMNIMVYVKFLEITAETWINSNNLIRVTSRDKMDLFLADKRGIDGENAKYINNIPPTMKDSYDMAWKKYNELITKRNQKEENYEVNKVAVIEENIMIKDNMCSICEVCVSKEIEFDCGPRNKHLLELPDIERSKWLTRIDIAVTEDSFQCDNRCVWRYHRRCVADNSDLVCSCNKSAWRCSVCDKIVSLSQLFMCNNYECMRAYHKTCISAHLDLQSDTKQCPLHQCINCRLDDLVPLSDAAQTALTYCVKCKLAFHNHVDCLPMSYITIGKGYIICGRHLTDVGLLSSNAASFCFTCCSPTSEKMISCIYCSVTYHMSVHCLPTWVDVTEENDFICNGCKFPLARRWRYMLLIQPSALAEAKNMTAWKMGEAVAPSKDGRDITVCNVGSSSRYSVSLSRVISINLQSLDNLLCFGLQRFKDMQGAISKLSSFVSEIIVSLNMRQNYHRNAFVLNFSSLFPVTDNVYATRPEVPAINISCSKCVCTDCCCTANCPKVAAKTECTDLNCSLLSRCRNRRMQKKHFAKQRLVLEGDEGPNIVLEEAVVKDVLVMELVGEVKKLSLTKDIREEERRMCLFALSDTDVIDNSRFCGLFQFVHHSEWPNLVSKSWSVSGLKRIGLFSSRRIGPNEALTVDMHTVLADSNIVQSVSASLNALVPWKGLEVPGEAELESEECAIIDLCEDDGEPPEEEDSDTRMLSRRPLCPICLRELTSDYSAPRPMVHCVNCFTVHHLLCAAGGLTASRKVSRVEKDPRIMRYVCDLCRQMDE